MGEFLTINVTAEDATCECVTVNVTFERAIGENSFAWEMAPLFRCISLATLQ